MKRRLHAAWDAAVTVGEWVGHVYTAFCIIAVGAVGLVAGFLIAARWPAHFAVTAATATLLGLAAWRWTKVRQMLRLAVTLIVVAYGVALALHLASERGPKCDSAEACETYEPPEDFGVP